MVSEKWASAESVGASAAAMPPCAQRVDPLEATVLVTRVTPRPARGQPQRRGEPGDAGADDDDVGAGGGAARPRRPAAPAGGPRPGRGPRPRRPRRAGSALTGAPATRSVLSSSRVPPTRAASRSTAGPAWSAADLAQVDRVHDGAVVGARRRARASAAAAAARTSGARPAGGGGAAGLLARAGQRGRGGPAPRRRGRRCGWSGRGRRARGPSSPATTSTPTARSSTIRATRASCWRSLRPNTATSGRTRCSRSSTTVRTPSKWPGRAAPSQRVASSPAATRTDGSPCGYTSPAVGARTRSTPSRAQTARSASSVRG